MYLLSSGERLLISQYFPYAYRTNVLSLQSLTLQIYHDIMTPCFSVLSLCITFFDISPGSSCTVVMPS